MNTYACLTSQPNGTWHDWLWAPVVRIKPLALNIKLHWDTDRAVMTAIEEEPIDYQNHILLKKYLNTGWKGKSHVDRISFKTTS